MRPRQSCRCCTRPDSVAAHSRLGLNVVVDVAHHRPEILSDCARRLAGLPVLFVGVRCPLAVVIERLVYQPLANAPDVTVFVATAGVGLLLIALTLWIAGVLFVVAFLRTSRQ